MRLILAAALFACASHALAQNQPTVYPFRTLRVEADTIDTRSFSPQIDDKFVPHPERPENPMEISRSHGLPNDLPVGQVMNVARGTVGPLWPAITATGWNPPDPDLAVGPNHAIVVVNMSLAFYQKNGTPVFQQTAQSFFQGMGAGDFQFDPKCFFDPMAQRYVMLFLELTGSSTSKILLAVSDDADPVGVWRRYRLEARLVISGNIYWADYPGLGYNKDAYVVTANMFPFGGGQFAGVQFMVIPKAPLLEGSPATVQYLRDSNGASAQVSEVGDLAMERVFAISRNGQSAMTVYALSDLLGTPVLNETNVTVPTNAAPTIDAPSTNGNTLDSLDGRTYNAVWRDGTLLTAHTVQQNSRLRVRWYEIATNNWPTSGTPTLSMSGEVTGDAGIHHHMGVVNKNAVGDISTIFTRSSTSIAADIMYAGRFAADPAGTMGIPVNLESSSGNDYPHGRWGDYFGIDVDPIDNTTFWGVAMGIAPSNEWRTAVFSWAITPAGTTVVPTTLSLETGTILSGGVGDLATSNDVRVQFRPGVVLTSNEYPVRAVVQATSANLNPASLRISVESQASATNLNQRVEAFDFDANQWVLLDLRSATVNTDGTIELNLTSPARFVDAAGLMRTRVSFKTTAPVLTFPWTGRVDRLIWIVSN